jgi:hypothetical protein
MTARGAPEESAAHGRLILESTNASELDSQVFNQHQ